MKLLLGIGKCGLLFYPKKGVSEISCTMVHEFFLASITISHKEISKGKQAV